MQWAGWIDHHHILWLLNDPTSTGADDIAPSLGGGTPASSVKSEDDNLDEVAKAGGWATL